MIKDLLILVGGQGTRLKSVSGDVPKPLVPIYKEMCILDFILRNVQLWNVKRTILCICYKPEFFRSWLNSRSFDFDIEIVVEDSPLGTGGAILNAVNSLEIKSPFAVMNGDTYAEINFGEMTNSFDIGEYKAMIGLSKVKDSGRYGTVDTAGGLVSKFIEKNNGSEGGWINNGTYILLPELFDGMHGKFSIEHEIFPKLCSEGHLGAFHCFGAFRDIGVPEDFNLFSRCEAKVILEKFEYDKTNNLILNK